MNPLFIFKTNVHFLPTFAFIILYSFPLLMKKQSKTAATSGPHKIGFMYVYSIDILLR